MAPAASTIPWTTQKVLSFDIFGTLIEQSKGMHDAILSTTFGKHLPTNLSGDEIVERFIKYERDWQGKTPKAKQSEIMAQSIRQWAIDLCLVESGTLTADEVEESAQTVGQSMGTWPPFADTVAAMQSLAKHYHLVPLSNVDRETWQRTTSGPLKEVPFAAAYLAEDIGSYKPDHVNFEYLLKHIKSDFGAEKSELTHIAFSTWADCDPSRDMAIKCVFVDRNNEVADDEQQQTQHQEVYQYALRVKTLGEVAEIVERAWENA